MEKPIKVRIFDQEYLIRSEENEEWVQGIAKHVNDKFREIINNVEGLSEKKIAILAAFNIASDYFQLLKDRDEVATDIEQRVKALNYQIDLITK